MSAGRLDLRAVERLPDTVVTAETEHAVCVEIAQALLQTVAHIRALRAALLKSSMPYLALLLDGESRKWIAPSIWAAIESAAAEGEDVLASCTDGDAAGAAPEREDP